MLFFTVYEYRKQITIFVNCCNRWKISKWVDNYARKRFNAAFKWPHSNNTHFWMTPVEAQLTIFEKIITDLSYGTTQWDKRQVKDWQLTELVVMIYFLNQLQQKSNFIFNYLKVFQLEWFFLNQKNWVK